MQHLLSPGLRVNTRQSIRQLPSTPPGQAEPSSQQQTHKGCDHAYMYKGCERTRNSTRTNPTDAHPLPTTHCKTIPGGRGTVAQLHDTHRTLLLQQGHT